MQTFLILSVLPADSARLADHLVRTATCFLEANGGAASPIDLGSFRRDGRRETVEVLKLVGLQTDAPADDDAQAQTARSIEKILRSTAVSAGIPSPDVRVFIANA